MPKKPAHEELEKRIEELEKELACRKRLEEQIKKTNKLLRSVIQQAPSAIQIHEGGARNMNVVIENDESVRIMGERVEGRKGLDPNRPELLSTRFYSMDGSREIPLKDMPAPRAFQGETVKNETYIFRHADGKEIMVEAGAAPVYDEDRHIIAVVVTFHDITGRSRAAEALLENEQKLLNIIEFFPDAVLGIDMQKRIRIWNRAIEEMTGVAASEMIGKGEHAYTIPFYGEARPHLMDLVFEDSKEISERYPKIVRQGDTLLAEAYCNALYDHKGAWVFAKASPLRDGSGNLIGAIECIRDITPQKQAEQDLREREEVMRYIIQHDPNALAVYDKELRYIAVSDRYLKDYNIWGIDVIGRHHYEVFPEIPQQWRVVHQRVLQGATERNEDDWFERPDGSVTYNRWECRPWYHADGSIGGMITYTEVTTERKLAEKALRESENKYRGLFESLVDGVAESDLEGTIISCNRAYQEMTGHTEAELKKLKYQDLTPAKWREVDKAHIEQAMQRGYSDQYEKERLRRDGTTFPISMRIWLKRNSKGEPVGFWGIIRDISERVRAQEERDKLQNQLYQAQKMESIGRLAGGVAHDLNNLLSPILGYGEMLLDDTAPSDPRREPLEEVVSAGKRAQTLVRQLLAFSRKQPLQFQAVDMNRLIGDFKKLLRRTVREDIRIRTKLSRSIPQVKGDIGQIEQVIMNLAVNAQDAMPEGGTLTLETSAVELDAAYAGRKKGVTPGAYVRVAISDTGTGMDDETLEHLFEPFFTTKETGKGTGLGLSTAYGIIKQHGGNIWAYSEPGLGTTIKLYLPVPEADFESEASLPQAAKNTKGSEVLLLVEDDRQVRNLSSVILQRQGYKVLPAPNGKEALCLLEEHKDRIDLLLTDVIMPDMNGKELFEKVSALHPGVRVLYMSGYTDDVIAHHGVIDAGVNFIEKPFTVKALAAKVREVLEG